jgi:hypothetical protein
MKNCTATSFCARCSAACETSAAGEAPDDDRAGESLDRGVDAEADQRDGAGEDDGEDRDRPFERHVGQAGPRQHLDVLRQAPVGLAVDGPGAPARIVRARPGCSSCALCVGADGAEQRAVSVAAVVGRARTAATSQRV